MFNRHLTPLAFDIEVPANTDPPSEFRIFRAGLNESSVKSSVLFDDAAGHNVMEFYRRRGMDVAIDKQRRVFSDAIQRRKGLVEVADKGTLFLDEIGDLPLSLQAKLLKVVEERRFRCASCGR